LEWYPEPKANGAEDYIKEKSDVWEE